MPTTNNVDDPMTELEFRACLLILLKDDRLSAPDGLRWLTDFLVQTAIRLGPSAPREFIKDEMVFGLLTIGKAEEKERIEDGGG